MTTQLLAKILNRFYLDLNNRGIGEFTESAHEYLEQLPLTEKYILNRIHKLLEIAESGNWWEVQDKVLDIAKVNGIHPRFICFSEKDLEEKVLKHL